MYLALKTLHVLSSTVLFGTGLGIAFFLWAANRSGDRAAQKSVTKLVVKADLWFTTPAVLVQPASGLALAHLAGFSVGWMPLNWLGASVLLYGLAGACWLPVLWLQWRMRELADTCSVDRPLPAEYWQYSRWWTALGVPAFSALVGVFWLMTAKPF